MSVRRMQGVSAHIEYINPKEKKRKIECRESYSNICQYNKSEHYLTKCVEKRCKYYEDLLKDKEKSNNKANRRAIDRSSHPYLNKNIFLISLKTKKEIKIKIVVDSEEIPFEGLYSQNSEVGKLLLNKRVNDVIVIKYFNDEFKYKIKEIR